MDSDTPRRLRIFLCHVSEDKPAVRTLYRKLQSYNLEIWFDEQNLLPGERWEHIISDVIQNCDIVLICLSRAFLIKEGYAHYEVHTILETAKSKPPNTIYHIPFRLDDCELPAHLREWHYVSDFVAGDFEKIIAACEKRRTWLNVYHGANIASLQTHLTPLATVVRSQENLSDQDLPKDQKNTVNHDTPTASSRFQQATSSERINGESSPQRAQGALLRQYDMHASGVLAVEWEPKGTRIASAGADGTVRIWEAETGVPLLTYHSHPRLLNTNNLQTKIYTVTWSPKGKHIAFAGNGPMVYIWSTESGQTLTRYEEHSGMWSDVFTVAWTPDGQRIASVCSHTMGNDKTIHVWDAVTSETLRCYDTHYHWLPDFFVYALAWSSDGVYLAAACGDKTIRVWNTAIENLIPRYIVRAKLSNHIAWSPDNRYLASAHTDHTVRVWDMLTQTNIKTFYKHSDSVRSVAWSPDGTRIASASNDKTVRLWEALTGTPLYTYRGHIDQVTSVVWSPDGTRIASASNDKTVHIWQADNE